MNRGTAKAIVKNLLWLIPLLIILYCFIAQDFTSPQKPATPVSDKAACFSKPSGSYNESFYLELSCPEDSDAVILYSLDGSDPDRSSFIYRSPIRIEENSEQLTVVKARIYEADSLGETSAACYYVSSYDAFSLPEMCIAVDPYYLFSNEEGTYVSGSIGNMMKARGIDNPKYGNYALHKEYDSDIFFEEPAGFADWHGTIRVAGGFSRPLCVQKVFSLKLDAPENLLGQNIDCYKLKAQGWGEHFWNSKTDAFINTACESLDIGSAEGRFVNLFVNYEYWGIYTLQEDDDPGFWERHYAIDTSRFTDIEYTSRTPPKYQVEDSEDYYDEIFRYIQEHSLEDEEVYDYVSSRIDIDNFTNFMVSQIFFANTDYINHNTEVWRTEYVDPDNPYADMRWRWKLHDLDACLSRPADEDTLSGVLETAYDKRNNVNLTIVLFQKLYETQRYRNLFKTRFLQMLDNELSYEVLEKEFDLQEDQLRPDMELNLERYNHGYEQDKYGYLLRSRPKQDDMTIEDWEENNEKIKRFLYERNQYFRSYFQSPEPSADI